MSFIFLIASFLLLVLSRQILINLLWRTAGLDLAKTLYFVLFFPGVLIHEFSHLFIATLLFVPTGEITIFPEEKRVGSIQIAKTDPIRGALIGIAPTIIGTAVILAIFQLFKNEKNFLFLYLIFAINNTMFSSESDRRSFLGLIALVAFIVSFLYLFGLLSQVAGPFVYYASLAAKFIATAYASTFLVNLIFIIPLFVLQKCIHQLSIKIRLKRVKS